MALDGLRVVDRSATVAGRRLGSLLADQGASVVAERARSLGDPVFDRAKYVVSDAAAWVSEADVLIDDQPGVEVDPDRIHVLLPPFPADHPHHGWRRAEAAEGAAAVHRPPIGGPRVPPFDIAAPVAALFAAIGTMGALMARDRGEGVQTVRVPQLDAGLATQELAALLTVGAPRSWVALQWAGSPFVTHYAASDGDFVYLHAGLPHHLKRFLQVLRRIGCDRSADQLRHTLSAATRADPSAVGSVREAAALQRLLTALFASRPARVWEEQLASEGLCLVAARTGGAWRDHPHPRGAGHVVEVADPMVGSCLQPGPLVRLPSTPTPRPQQVGGPSWSSRERPPSSPRGQLPLAGVRVLDLSQVIAGPTAGRALAWLGADVLHVENPRMTAGWVDAFHTLFQAGKRSRFIDLGDVRGRDALASLLGSWRPDVVLHNLAEGADRRLGLSAESCVLTSVSAWGRTGPWAHRRGWEQTIQAACGVQLDHGGDRPELLPVPIHDLATGLAAAFGTLCALHGGGRGEVEASLAMTSVWLQDHLFRGVGRAPWTRRGPDARRLDADAGWQKGHRGWRLIVDRHSLPYRSLRQALAERPSMWRRVDTLHGPVTEVGCPIQLSRTPCLDLAPAPPRGGGEAVVVDRRWWQRVRRDSRWLRRTVKWGAWVASQRVGLSGR